MLSVSSPKVYNILIFKVLSFISFYLFIINLLACLSILFIALHFIYLPFCSLFIFIYLSVYIYVNLFNYLSSAVIFLFLFIYLFFCLSIYKIRVYYIKQIPPNLTIILWGNLVLYDKFILIMYKE